MSTSKIKKARTPIKSGRGRPRSPETREKILKAAYEMLIEVGFMDLTIEGVAARAEVGKPTIYRRWKTKSALAMDAFLEGVNPEITFPDTGMAKEDFREQMQKVVKLMNSPRGEVLANVIGCGQANNDLITAFRENWLTPRREDAKRIFRRGVERGELREGIDAEVAIDALYSPLFYRLLLKHQPLTKEFVNELVDLVMSGLGEHSFNESRD
ncbi:Transcriptional regulator [Hyella patelloides LEGE 07179]|uniref:Transcriptional regulator n=1 Tax=Hyella patelloides LEGE 07179 TaxID=945734 RepID=A0A563VK36_9CYAN|nr:TetR/AcrR family transcriptional regulator [Hyella patelloides]VEP11794.1 Transcriptional regulator [Hyella patelloides LEGE 07179]